MENQNSPSRSVPWLSLEARDFEIFVADFSASKQPAVVISGSAALTASEISALTAIGFRSVPGRRTVYARSGGSFNRREIETVFPSARQLMMPVEKTRRRFGGANPLEQSAPAPSLPTAPNSKPAAHPDRPATREGHLASEPEDDMSIELPIWDDAADVDLLARRSVVEGVAIEMANDFQARYVPASRLGTATTMVPANMAAPIDRAYRTLQERYGDVDALVGASLGWSADELASRLSVEQIDAVAVFIKSLDDGKAEILADQTGVGKGRVLAACVVIAIRRGLKVIFLTETANLFSDFWRDVMDIDAAHIVGEPYILNASEKIFDLTAEEPRVLFSSWSAKKQASVIESSALPDGVRLCFATYSQFNRSASAKARYLMSIAQGALLVEDESHNAAGDSNIAATIDLVEQQAGCCLYSSATFAARPENMSAYAKALPDCFRGQDVPAVLRAGGQALQAALAQGLVADGRLLRREHDLSGISIEVAVDIKRQERHRQYADALSPILARMARLSRLVEARVGELNRRNEDIVKALPAAAAKEAREKWTAGNFGGRLGLITRQFLTALKIDFCIETCLDVLSRGEKPVVVIDITMETVLRELQDGDDTLVWAGHPTFGSLRTAEDGAAAPSFGDALAVMLRRIVTVKVKRGTDEPEKIAITDGELIGEAEAIMALVRAFAYLPLSPMDAVREGIEAAPTPDGGRWAVGEITGRSLRVSNGVCEPMPPRNRNETVIKYNNGSLDCIFITKPGSAGLSLHASERVKDKRRRILIELEIPSNVVNRIQRWGRVNRRGQTSVPGFITLATSLPFEVRNMAIQNRKVEQLSAQVTASAETATLMDVPDLINSVGNDVCKRLLTSRPQWAEAMDISLDIEEEDDELYFVNKFLFRLILLPAAHQENLYRAVLGAYQDAIHELAARGIAPRRNREMAGVWKTVAREIYDSGDPADGSVFGAPVFLSVIEAEVDAAPIREREVLEMVAAARHDLEGLVGSSSDFFASYRTRIAQERPRLLAQSLSKRFSSVEQALKASESNSVKLEAARLKEMHDLLGLIEPGTTMSAQNEDGELRLAVIVAIRPPDVREAWFPGKYLVKYLFPGDEQPREISVAGLMRQPGLTVYPLRAGRDCVEYPAFRAVAHGRVAVRRHILDGNIFAAVRCAVDAGFGSAVTYLDAMGIRHQGVLIPKSRESALKQAMRGTRTPEVAFEIMRQAGGTIWTNAERSLEGVTCSRRGNRFVATVGGDRRSKRRFSSEAFSKALGVDPSSGVPPRRMLALLRQLVAVGEVLYFEGRHNHIALKAAASVAMAMDNEDINKGHHARAS